MIALNGRGARGADSRGGVGARAWPGGCSVTQDDAAAVSPTTPPSPAAEKSLLAFPSGADVN